MARRPAPTIRVVVVGEHGRSYDGVSASAYVVESEEARHERERREAVSAQVRARFGHLEELMASMVDNVATTRGAARAQWVRLLARGVAGGCQLPAGSSRGARLVAVLQQMARDERVTGRTRARVLELLRWCDAQGFRPSVT